MIHRTKQDLENFMEWHLSDNDINHAFGLRRMSRSDARAYLTLNLKHWPEYAKALAAYEMAHNGVH